ncbi:MAG: alpha-L-fucosidase, partial [Prevotellaceae bacterium]|nr:alpha-L-fucosidase [Prevotellaceae bacterium]
MNKYKISGLIFTAILLLQFNIPLHSQQMDKMWGEQNAKDSISKRGRFFDWGNYAMFIHWGLYSTIANQWEGKTYYGIGEWIMNSNMANIPVDEYKAVAKNFNPTLFDATKIAKLAKDAGMKYI